MGTTGDCSYQLVVTLGKILLLGASDSLSLKQGW